jgi:LmbE family N-acetylglucosaminyl deacetylase
MGQSVVAVMAHPGGFEIHFVTVCNGDVGSMTLPREEIARVRRGESEASAQMMGATYDCLGVGDLRLTFDHNVKTRIVEALRKYRADLVITHSAQDYMTDHEITSLLTREACFAASAPNWPVPTAPRLKPLDHIPELYYSDRTSMCDADGNFVEMPIVVDIASVMERKENLLKCHASQREWLRSQHGEDNYVLSMRNWSALRGRQAGFKFGEGFRQHRGTPFPKTTTLTKSLASTVSSKT